jgi:hypothetical protein
MAYAHLPKDLIIVLFICRPENLSVNYEYKLLFEFAT